MHCSRSLFLFGQQFYSIWSFGVVVVAALVNYIGCIVHSFIAPTKARWPSTSLKVQSSIHVDITAVVLKTRKEGQWQRKEV